MPRGQWLRFQGLRVALKTGIRIEAPIEAVLPRRELPWHALLSRWEERRRELEEWLLMVDPSILGTPRFRHPIAGWLDVLDVNHQSREVVVEDALTQAGAGPRLGNLVQARLQVAVAPRSRIQGE